MKIVLFDRDGTVLYEPADTGAVTMSNMKLFPDTLEAMTKLAEAGFSIVFITNQNITNGVLKQEEFDATEIRLRELLAPTGIKILKTYLCPHHAEYGCDCRKPKPKMMLDAIKEFELDPSETYMVGDRATDVKAGQAAGLKTILVKTGNLSIEGANPTYVANSLTEVVDYLISSES